MRFPQPRTVLLALTGLLAFYLLVGFFVLPIVVDRTLRSVVSDTLGLECEIGEVAFNPILLTLEVRDFDLPDHAGEPLVGVGRLFVDLETSSIINGALTWRRIAVEGLDISVVVNEAGELNLLALIPPDDGTEAGAEEEEATGAEEPSDPLGIIIHDLELAGASIHLIDHSTGGELNLDFSPIDLRVRSFFFGLGPEAAGSDLDLKIDLAGGGHVDVTGTIDTEPVEADIKIAVADVQLSQLQSLVDAFLNVEIQSGHVGLDATVRYAMDEPDPLTLGAEIALDDVVIHDPADDQTLLRLPALRVEKIVAGLEPTQLSIAQIALSEPYVRVALGPDGVPNVQRMLVDRGEPEAVADTEANAEPAVAADPSEEAGPTPRVSIGAVRMTGGEIRFDDMSIAPAFGITIDALEAAVERIDTQDDGATTFQLAGNTGPQEPFKISGEAKLFDDSNAVDVTVVFRSLGLERFSPYSGQFAGYPITRGRMDIDLSYTLAGTHLKGANDFLLDQVTLGDKVKSADAPNLPLPLGLALIKDTKGRIDLDIPIEGDVDDPSFSIGGVVWKTFTNLIIKSVTKPFGALAMVTGGKGPPDEIDFEPGKARIGASQAGQLDLLADALAQRPALALTLVGTANAEADRMELARKVLDGLVRDSRFGEKRTPEEDRMILTTKERLDSTVKIYKKRVERSGTGAQKLPDGQPESDGARLERLERGVIETIEIPDARLLEVAAVRANAVSDYLVRVGGLAAGRVSVDEPRIESKKDEARVEMELDAIQ